MASRIGSSKTDAIARQWIAQHVFPNSILVGVSTAQWLCVFFLFSHFPAFALNPSQSITQYAHTAWNRLGSLPNTQVNAFAQTRDGYLWLGMEDTGLIRFDGKRFIQWQALSNQALPNKSIHSLRSAKDGGLWVGTRGGLMFLKDGTFKTSSTNPVFTTDPVTTIYEDQTGIVWVGTYNYESGGLLRIDRGHVQRFGPSEGLAGSGVHDIFRDSNGRLWISGPGGLTLWDSKQPLVLSGTTSKMIYSVAESPDGSLWLASDQGLLSYSQQVQRHPLLQGNADVKTYRVLVDRDGGVWIGTLGQGLFHLSGDRVEHMTRADGLSSDKIYALFEDREGNIWAGTANGIDLFREYKVPTFSTHEGLPGSSVSTVLRDSNGSICAGIQAVGVYCVSGSMTYRLPNSTVSATHIDHSGRLIAATPAGVVTASKHGSAVINNSLKHVYSLTEDQDHSLWLGDIHQGLFRLDSSGKLTSIGADRFTGNAILFLLEDREGRLWIALRQGGLSIYQNGAFRSFSTNEGLGSGFVHSVFQDHSGTIWAATDGGLSRYNNGRFVTLTTHNGLPCDSIQDILEDDLGSLWLRTSCGLVRAKLADLMAANISIPYEIFGPSDGFQPTTTPGRGTTPRAAKSHDGRLWFVTAEGIDIVDPQHIPRNTTPPPVLIEQMTGDGKSLDMTRAVKLPPTVMRLQIDYTALSFTDPDRVLFRYRLEGLDPNWVDAGTRRQAFYTNLRPGSYRFRVIACNNDGVWNETGASFSFNVEAAFLQTSLFAWTCAGTGMLFVWLYMRLHRGHGLRVRDLTRSYPTGIPGVGLLLLRIAIGFDLLTHATFFNPFVTGAASVGLEVPRILEAWGGLLLIAGLGTPIASALLTSVLVLETVQRASSDAAYASLRGPWESALLYLVILGALTLLGPGAYSLDARLFGRRRVAVVFQNVKE